MIFDVILKRLMCFFIMREVVSWTGAEDFRIFGGKKFKKKMCRKYSIPFYIFIYKLIFIIKFVQN